MKLFRETVSWNCLVKLLRETVSWNCFVKLFRETVSWNCFVKLFRETVSWNCQFLKRFHKHQSNHIELHFCLDLYYVTLVSKHEKWMPNLCKHSKTKKTPTLKTPFTAKVAAMLKRWKSGFPQVFYLLSGGKVKVWYFTAKTEQSRLISSLLLWHFLLRKSIQPELIFHTGISASVLQL